VLVSPGAFQIVTQECRQNTTFEDHSPYLPAGCRRAGFHVYTAPMFGLISALLRGALAGLWHRLIHGPTLPSWSFKFDLTVWVQRAVVRHIATMSGLALRRISAQGGSVSAPVAELIFIAVDSPIPGAWIRPVAGDGRGVVLFLHGGGYVIGSVESHRDFAGRMVIAGGFDVFSLEYRLAPEHPHPAALEDAIAAYRWLLAEGHDPTQICVAGDSAGGGLATALLIALRDAGDPLPAGAGLVCPWVDLTSSQPSIESNAHTDYLSHAVLDKWSREYAGAADRSLPLISPVEGDLSGLPPLLIQVGNAEILRDEGVLLSRRVRDAGGKTELVRFPEMPHDWHLMANVEPRGQRAIAELAVYLRRTLDAR
jgi:monoterpene epsilon-lactone hydrolase